MAIVGGTQFLERIQFFNGERLFASDLQAIEAFNREMRWLHNQSLHQPGVGSGFAVTGNTGDRLVTISPGYAVDSDGREIILTETQTLAIPPVADNGSGSPVFYDLTVSYPNDIDLKPSEIRAGICVPNGVVRLREEPVFCWVRLSDDPVRRQPVDPRLQDRIAKGFFIVLAQVEIFNCQLKHPVKTSVRPNARPSKHPRIGCGIETSPAWKREPAPSGSALNVTFGGIMYTAMINTSCGGFQSTPSYVARLAGPRIGTSNQTSFIADALINIVHDPTIPSPSARVFTIQIFPVVSISVDPDSLVRQWQVAWMGVED
jgi:hypothetical protein